MLWFTVGKFAQVLVWSLRWLYRRLLDVLVVASDLLLQSHQMEVRVMTQMSHPAILPVTTFIESSTHDWLLRTHADRKDRVGAEDVLWNFSAAEKNVLQVDVMISKTYYCNIMIWAGHGKPHSQHCGEHRSRCKDRLGFGTCD